MKVIWLNFFYARIRGTGDIALSDYVPQSDVILQHELSFLLYARWHLAVEKACHDFPETVLGMSVEEHSFP